MLGFAASWGDNGGRLEGRDFDEGEGERSEEG